MTYICFVDNHNIESCSLVMSEKKVKKSRFIISVNKNEAVSVINRIISFLIIHNYNLQNSCLNFSYDCVNIVVPYLNSINQNYTIIDPDSTRCLWC